MSVVIDTEPPAEASDSRAELEIRAVALAEIHTAVKKSGGIKTPLLKDPARQETLLNSIRQHYASVSEQEQAISYAGEWLLDNFYVIQQAVTQVIEDIPDRFYDELPKLDSTPLRGFPRVYAIARAIADGSVNPVTLDQIKAFIGVYQDVTPLTMGELWALPATLRAVNLENLIWTVGQLIGLPEAHAILDGTPAPEHEADETHVANAIINLRMLATQDWKAYFESVSYVEQALRQDPADIYPRMDFTTRNRYRQMIEQLAPDDAHDELRVAEAAIALAQAAYRAGKPGDRAGHVGFYLLDAGIDELKAKIAYRPALMDRLSDAKRAYPTATYISAVVIITVVLLLPFVLIGANAGASALQMILVLLAALLPVIAAAVNVVNWAISRTVKPSFLPKMDFSKGIPLESRAVVVIPAMLSDRDEVDTLAQQIEQHFLRNGDPGLAFALLLDYLDAPQRHMDGDDDLVRYARESVEALNIRYGTDTRKPFYLFLRERRWNLSEDVWMGWERKRGKLCEFNTLVLNPSAETSYTVRDGDLTVLGDFKYVITLDADTILPKDSAHRLVATMAHPLNRPQTDAKGIVTAGYTVLQPRVEISPTTANRTLFTRTFAGDTGYDLYTLAVSDVYQDWFGEGIFTGKGIYDVAAFQRCLAGKVPENSILSHDLFEGIHGRAGLLTDVVLLEDYPSHYIVHSRRIHRWTRGDWQLLPWLGRRVPLENGGTAPNPLSVLDRWKIVDNLRRSLTPPALLVMFAFGWLYWPNIAPAWTIAALLVCAAPFLTGAVDMLWQRIRGVPWSALAPQIKANAIRWWLSLVFLPFEAFLSLDAIIVTLGRLKTRRHMLQWTTAARAQRLFRADDGAAVWRQMASETVYALVMVLLVTLLNPAALWISSVVIVLWLSAPSIAHWLSQPATRPVPPLTFDQETALRNLARRTWMFFEQFVGPEDHWLPPDHYQELPRGIIAHHTSPTNIGLLLVATLGAYDIGHMGLLELSARLKLTFESLDKLERHRGHFLNWYDTRTLTPLLPRYVSTVDSGNLACCLLTLRQGIGELAGAPVLRPQRWQGIRDNVGVIEEALAALKTSVSGTKVDELFKRLAEIRAQVRLVQDDASARTLYLEHLSETIWPDFTRQLLEVLAAERDNFDVNLLSTLSAYAERMTHQLRNVQRDTVMLLPWLFLLIKPPALFSEASTSADIIAAWRDLRAVLPPDMQVENVAAARDEAGRQIERLADLIANSGAAPEEVKAARAWCGRLSTALDTANAAAGELMADFASLGQQIEAYTSTMDFRFLFDPYRKIFHIGYSLTTERLDNSYYDLLASEARLASLFAIATGQIPQEHWLQLGRPQTNIGGTPALLSWSGTMFEYLMPMLLTRTYPGTLLEQSYAAVVNAHIDYGRQNHVPWGISESGYFAFDGNQNYQYRAFGVPSIAFKRGLASDMVVAPYASILALPVNPLAVIDNMAALNKLGALGRYGYYEALDYTTSRLTLGQESEIVREYMAHHQGMILLTLVNALSGGGMTRRFHADSRIQSVELLLQEQIPKSVEFEYPSPDDESLVATVQPHVDSSPWEAPVNGVVPQTHFLSNGRFSTLLTSTGDGYSQWQSSALTRWRADTTLEEWGTWIYLRDLDSGVVWSAAYQPVPKGAESQKVIFYPHKAVFQRRDRDISVEMEITIPPDDDLEIRRIRLTNQGDTPRRLQIASYGEVVLSRQENDQRHQAFNKLFIESEFLPQVNGLLFRRRPRSSQETGLFMLHMLALPPDAASASASYEADRARFLGRNRTVSAPAAMDNENGLSGTTGATLDPVMALGHEITLDPHASTQIAFVTVAAETRGQALTAARTYTAWSIIDRAFDQARYRSELEMRQLDIGSPDIRRFQKMLSALMYPQAALRAASTSLNANTKKQSGLWAHGISGDYPIVLLRISDETEAALVRDLIQAHRYWRNRQIKVTLVILNERDTGYTQELYNAMHRLIVRMGSELWINRHDGIFLLRADLLSEADRALLAASARVLLDSRAGQLSRQLDAADRQPVYLPNFAATLAPASPAESTPPLERPSDLGSDNGFGGFSPDGKEYIIYRQPGSIPPAPWSNVIANADFGFTVTESGGGFTWAGNSSENRLTAWRNDPVTDMPSEAIYLRDEETAEVWSPTPLPAGTDQPYLVRHGFGYSVFEHHSHGLKQRSTLFAATDAPVKIIRLRLENTSNRVRRITVTYYAEWVLGTSKDITQQYIIPEFDPASQTLLFRNPYSIEFGNQFAFITANKTLHGLTTDRTEFLGRVGDYRRPAALDRIGLSGTVLAGTDPCAAVQLHVDLLPDAAEEVFFLIGAGENREAALDWVEKYRRDEQIDAAWQAVGAFWTRTLSAVTVRTPDTGMNAILPWLLYQALSCRIWGRSALYQSSGAFGFRDQLQDVMALIHSHPHLTREQILRAAEHQFEAGDVLHWWHPPSGRGVRTRFSDDLVWLPFVTAYYVKSTGDFAILDEKVPFLRGEPLKAEEDERYGLYESTEEGFTLYDHCRRALNKALTAGVHGLPLMGIGDWNDGMSRVGVHGRGESVWMGWFLYRAMADFIPICQHTGDEAQAAAYRLRMSSLQSALETSAWDGEWYLRAFYDDGTPLGSAQNSECQIDSIAQSWSVLSKAGDSARAQKAMNVVKSRLIHPDDRLMLLFTPPFDKTEHDPGYIKGYPPGVRENGGQYTHAAIWTAWAFAEMGDGDQAESLFQLLNPIYHSNSPEKAGHYRVEPYVIAADIYGAAPHTGRGGWTWYTGSSGWMYRLGVEAILGLRRDGAALVIDPRIPKAWPGFEISYAFGQSEYQIAVKNPGGAGSGVREVTLDGNILDDRRVPLIDDGAAHQVVVTLG